MNDVRGSLSMIAAPQSASRMTSDQGNVRRDGIFAVAGTPTKASGVELLQSARLTQDFLRSAAREVSEYAEAQGRADALESVTGSNSLTRGAAEVAELIRVIEVKLAAQLKNQERVEDGQ